MIQLFWESPGLIFPPFFHLEMILIAGGEMASR